MESAKDSSNDLDGAVGDGETMASVPHAEQTLFRVPNHYQIILFLPCFPTSNPR
jgi:hypothetical protein